MPPLAPLYRMLSRCEQRTAQLRVVWRLTGAAVAHVEVSYGLTVVRIGSALTCYYNLDTGQGMGNGRTLAATCLSALVQAGVPLDDLAVLERHVFPAHLTH